MSVESYKRETVRWMEDRGDGGLTQEQEASWAAKLHVIWDALTETQRTAVEAWVEEQKTYRAERWMPGWEKGVEDLTPGERAAVEFQGEYDLILDEGEHVVVFRVSGREIEISRGVLLDYDKKGRFWLAREDAESMGLLQ